MDSSNKFIYNGISWEASPTVSDKNTFFHAAFGVRTNEADPYLDKRVKFRRMRWATFLTFFENEAMPLCLADILGKCWSAHDKYNQASVADQDLFESYVSGIVKGAQDVTVKEIPILAALENLKVVLFSNGMPDPVIINPNVEMLGSYPNRETPKGEVVLYLDDNAFSRMNPVVEDPALKSTESVVKTVDENRGQSGSGLMKYKKGGSAGSEGVQYQVGLLTVFFLNALQKLTDWKLSTENKAAGKFDDVVLEWPEGATMLQAKHRQSKTKKVTFEELMSVNSKNNDFSLPKYFFSYEDNKKQFKLRNVIICTNANVDWKINKFLIAGKLSSQSMLHYENCDCLFYTFNDEILPHLKENIRSYYEKNMQSKDVDESVITDDNLKNFLAHLQFVSNYLPGNDVGKITEQLLSHMTRTKKIIGEITPLEIHNKILDWYHQKDGIYLTELYAKAIFSEIWRDKRWEILEKCNVFFHFNDLNFQSPKRLFHLTVGGGHLLQEIKVFRALQDKTKILFVNSDDGSQKQKQVLDAFGLPRYTILVLVCPMNIEDCILKDISTKLREILDKYECKKVVLLADPNNKIPQHIGLCNNSYDVVNESITFEDLSEDSQERLLKMENIIFQGKDISLEKLLAKQTSADYSRLLNLEILEKLVRNEKIKVGRTPLELDNTQFYIKRNFNRGDERKKRETVLVLPEELVCEINEKVMIISDSAGTGKSTVLTNLAVTIKKKHPHLWVIRIDLNDYTQILKEFLRKNIKSIDVLQLLDSKHSTKFTNQLEQAVFSTDGKVALMLDGFDEISPDYTQLVLSLLSLCREQNNFAKIFVTTRPHVAGQLQETLQVEPFILEPFTEQNQIHFLTSYWTHNLKVDDTKKYKCEQYAKALIYKLPLWVRMLRPVLHNFGAIPLHICMLADIFQENSQFVISEDWEGCKEYLMTAKVEPKLPENMNVSKLYKMFIEKKESVFLDKGSPSGNTAAIQALNKQFKESLGYHKSLALELILDKTKCELFSCYQQTSGKLELNILKIGIVQKIEGELHFVHRTFAEYFVAECLIEELQLSDQNVEFQRFFIEEILLEFRFNVICAFFNSFLQPIVDDLSSKTFHKYQTLSYAITSSHVHKLDLLHHLAQKGYVAILQLILKCMDLNFVAEIPDFMQLVSRCFRGGNPEPMHSNILNIVHAHIHQKGLDAIDLSDGKTLLEHASLFGQLEMVKFLVKQGANVNVGNFKPLHLAVDGGFFEVSKFLVEQGAEVRARRLSDGTTAPYRAILRNDTVTTAYLLDNILKSDGLNPGDPIVPYTVAYLGRLDTLKELVVERGLDANSRIENDENLIFGAARGGQLETIRYLVQQGMEVNARDKWNNTALHVISGNASLFPTAELLLKLGIDVDAQNLDGATAFHLAVEKSNFSLVKLLVSHRTNVNLKYKDENTGLHKAALNLQGNIVKFLVEHGADINSKNKYGQTALHLVILSGATSLKDIWPFEYYHDPAPCVVHLDIMQFLIERGGDVSIKDGNGNAALHLAAASGQLDRVLLLVKPEFDVNIKDKDGRTALHRAVLEKYPHVIKSLVQHEVDVNSRDNYGDTVMHYLASFKDQLDILKFILENGGNVNFRNKIGQTALHQAAQIGNFDAVILLVEFEVGVNIKDSFYNTALHRAVEEGHLGVVEYLVKIGADVTAKNCHERTALHIAAKGRCIEFLPKYRPDITKLADGDVLNSTNFFECQADTDTRNSEGVFVVKIDTENHNFDIVKILLAKCSEIVNLQDVSGWTALHFAVRKCRLDIVEFLVMHKADVSITNHDGQTALQLAHKDNSQNIVEFLMRHSANNN